MEKPLVILVSGPPCVGKTTLATRLASQLGMPLLSKDSIKETMFDTLGWSDREWSKKLGVASITLFYQWIDSQLVAGQSIVAESSFYRDLDAPMTCSPNWVQTFLESKPDLAACSNRELVRGEVAQGTVWANAIVVFTPCLDDGPDLAERREPMLV